MTHDWEEHDNRVKFIRTPLSDLDETVYFCLDGKFHSWAIAVNSEWEIRTLENPDRVHIHMSFTPWVEKISG